jgi:hypothetical protein
MKRKKTSEPAGTDNTRVVIVDTSDTQTLKDVEALFRDSARLHGRAANRRRAISQSLNAKSQQDAQQAKAIALDLDARLRRRDPVLRLKRKKSERARQVRAAWPKREEAPSVSRIRAWLPN